MIRQTEVEIQLIFSQINGIDSVNEKYTAEIYIESKWIDYDIKCDEKEYDSKKHWNPKIYVLNLQSGYSEENHYKLFFISNNTPTVFEIKKIRGDFWQPLELQYFPFDIQAMNVLVSTQKPLREVQLIENKTAPSKVYNNQIEEETEVEWDFLRRTRSTHATRQAIIKNAKLGVIDNNIWCLHKHVKINHFIYSEKYLSHSLYEETEHSTLNIRCRASRRPGYFLYNFFLLIFLITISSICVFAIDPFVSPNRFMASCTLLLTSITFRWILNNVLPNVRYLTSVDVYGLSSLLLITISLIWHSVFETKLVFINDDYSRHIDHVVCLIYIGLIVLIHIACLIWLIGVYRRRNMMLYYDKEYEDHCRSFEQQIKEFRNREIDTFLLNS